MDARDLFLDQHAAVHSAAVAGNKMSAAERAFGGLSDEQMRVRPREDLNSLAWLMWHVARAEDIMVNQVLSGRAQIFEDGWAKRLGITRRDFGIGMTSAEVTETHAPDRRRRAPRVPRRGRAPHARDRQRLQDARTGTVRCRRRACRRRPTPAASAYAPRDC